MVGSSSASQRDTSAPCLEYKSHNVAWLASLLREQSHAMDPTVNACVVWLHGDGETGHTWYLRFKSGVDRIRMPWIEFACPEADRRNWFGVDLPVINDSAVDGAELDAAIAHVHSELDAIQYKGIAASRIMLGGYGPGAALALLAGRTYGHDLAGIACMGGWLLRPNHPSSSARSPILLGHGEEDDDVPFELYRFACSWLTAEGYDLECQQYTGLGHRETAEAPTALAAPKNFITNRLPPILDAATLAERERAARERKAERERALLGSVDYSSVRAQLDSSAAKAVEGSHDDEGDSTAAVPIGGDVLLRCVSIEEDDDMSELRVVLELGGVKSMAELELSVGSMQVELRRAGSASAPLTIPLPKLIDPGAVEAAKFSKKTGQLRMSLRLA